jgi:hypothetical protein
LNPDDPADAGLDPDADGMNNRQEYLAGTGHLDPASYLKLERVVVAGAVTISFQAVANRTYSVLYTDSLVSPSWLNLTNVPAPAASGMMSVVDTQGGLQTRFYRLVTPAMN